MEPKLADFSTTCLRVVRAIYEREIMELERLRRHHRDIELPVGNCESIRVETLLHYFRRQVFEIDGELTNRETPKGETPP